MNAELIEKMVKEIESREIELCPYWQVPVYGQIAYCDNIGPCTVGSKTELTCVKAKARKARQGEDDGEGDGE